MRVLDHARTITVTTHLLERLPIVVLDVIGQSSATGVTEGALVRELTRYLPASIEPDEVRNRTLASIYWFRFNGDIAASGTHRYRIVPPYAVALDFRDEIQPEYRQLRLCGNPRRDGSIQSELKHLGGKYRDETITWDWWIAESYQPLQVGFRRTIEVADRQLSNIEKRLSQLGVPVISTQEFALRLPVVTGIFVPPREAFLATPPASGYWAVYSAQLKQDDRWETRDNWRSITPSLLRWMPTLDWRGERDSRYFYHNGLEHLAELSQSTAQLWMFFLDQQARNPRRIWMDGAELWLPGNVPDPHRQWLQLQAERLRWRTSSLYCRLAVEPTPVATRIAATLGLQIVEGRPL